MNQSALKTFAQDARNKLRQLIGARLDYVLTADTAELRQQAAQVNELRAALKNEGRDPLIERVAYTWFNRLAALRFMDANGYHPFGARVITPATANETLPELLQQARAGVLDENLQSAIRNPQLLQDLLAGRIPVGHPEAQVFKLLLVAACNYYHRLMPFLFEKIGDATELLLPEDLLTEHSIVADFRENLTDDDCREVEVIGWLYQFYISVRKDAVMARKSAVPTEDIPAVTQLFTPHWIVRYLVENSLGRLWLLNRPHSKLREKMPYFIDDEETMRQGDGATGRQGDYATLRQGDFATAPYPSHTVSKSQSRSDQCPKVDFLRVSRPEEIKLLDPACGSGHILTYAFDLLYAIYEEEGYDAPEIPSLILQHNLYGVEICDRAAALAAFALCMKARARDRRFFTRTFKGDGETVRSGDSGKEDNATARQGDGATSHQVSLSQSLAVASSQSPLVSKSKSLSSICPNVISLQEIHFADGELSEYIRAIGLPAVGSGQWPVNSNAHADHYPLSTNHFLQLLHQFEEAKTFGSLIQPCLSEAEIQSARSALHHSSFILHTSSGQLFLRETHAKVLRVLEQAEFLCQRYHVVVANPPYMGNGNMNAQMKLHLETHYDEGKADLFSVFIMRCIALSVRQGCVAMITMHGWMFLPTFKHLRPLLRQQTALLSMCHLGARGFDTISGEVVQTTAFVLTHQVLHDLEAIFHRLVEGNSEETKRQLFLSRRHVFKRRPSVFLGIDAEPLLYWLPEKTLEAFATNPISKIAKSGGRCKTHNDVHYVRFVWEIRASERHPNGKWKLLEHGGEFRKWFGNRQVVFNWSPQAKSVYAESGGLSNQRFWNKEGISWSDIGSGAKGFRFKPEDSEYSSLSPTLIPNTQDDLRGLLALLNTSLTSQLVNALNPSIHVNVGDALRLPYRAHPRASELASECIPLARADWDNFETSWDFRDLPLLRKDEGRIMNDEEKPAATVSSFIPHTSHFPLKGATLLESWQNWKAQCDTAIRRMQELETENNRLFIAAYGLQDELAPEVPEDQITLARADARKDMAAFLSYAVGCMFGRYSLDQPGLILADAGSTVADYERILAEKRAANPKGISSSSPGLRGTSYPGADANKVINPNRVASSPASLSRNPVGVEPHSNPVSQGSSSLATLGFEPESLQDSLREAQTSNSQPSTFNSQPSGFPPDTDGILPVLDGEWFQDDILGRFREFLRVTYGEEYLAENLAFIEASLGKLDAKTGKAKPTDLRTYFVREFYKEHLKTYKKRPIYWMFSSPEGSFQALIYLHRYTRDTVNLLLNDYVREFIGKLEEKQRQLTAVTLNESARPGDRTRAAKELGKIVKMLKEIRAWERDVLLPLAQQRIELDLDDGVKINYLKFKGAVVSIPGLEKADDE